MHAQRTPLHEKAGGEAANGHPRHENGEVLRRRHLVHYRRHYVSLNVSSPAAGLYVFTSSNPPKLIQHILLAKLYTTHITNITSPGL